MSVISPHLQHHQEVGQAVLGPHSLGVAQLHLQELGGPQDGGQFVSGLEQLPAGEDLGQETALGPEVCWSSRLGGRTGLRTVTAQSPVLLARA